MYLPFKSDHILAFKCEEIENSFASTGKRWVRSSLDAHIKRIRVKK